MMNRRWGWLLFLLCAALPVRAEISLRDDRGVLLTLPRSPQRTVSTAGESRTMLAGERDQPLVVARRQLAAKA